jgi:DNA recombination protein RmuC
MGFRTLAIQQRSSEVWQVLRAVKTEFGKFGDTLATVKKSLDTASSRIGQTESRTRMMLRSLKNVEAMPEEQAKALFAPEVAAADPDEGEVDPDIGDIAPDAPKKS